MFRIGAHRDEGCDFEFCENETSKYKPITGADDLGRLLKFIAISEVAVNR